MTSKLISLGICSSDHLQGVGEGGTVCDIRAAYRVRLLRLVRHKIDSSV